MIVRLRIFKKVTEATNILADMIASVPQPNDARSSFIILPVIGWDIIIPVHGNWRANLVAVAVEHCANIATSIFSTKHNI